MPTYDDTRFDPNFARDLLLEITHEQSLDELLQKFVRRVAERPAVARIRVWLVDKGDLCARCPQRQNCPDQTLCLHSVASAGKSPAGLVDSACSRMDDCYKRVPLGHTVIGRIAKTGERVVLRDLDKDPGEFAALPWLKQEQIREFGGMPIIYKGEILGVISVFSRVPIPEEAQAWRQLITDHVAGAIANARAFEEIQRLKARLEQQNAYLQEEVVEARAFGDLVGQSAALRQIISQIDLVAPTDASVLILGETGTGKELVAHEIHRRSLRKDKPLIRVNCASIPKDLYESEFFGHAKGAFTGAIKDRAGRFETADGGTLFLDEIGEVPLELQGKLLRVLQEKSYERVGEDRTRQTDVRIIAATNRDLKEEVAAGRFREDLYYRLNVFPMTITPLRERSEDIPLLAKHFVELSTRTLRLARPRLTRAAIAKLQGYCWPGNIRELRNVIERAVIIAHGGPLDFNLPINAAPVSIPAAPRITNGDNSEPEFLTEPEMQRRERENLLAILQKTEWKIKGPDGAAELLGIKSGTLISRIKKLGLKRPGPLATMRS